MTDFLAKHYPKLDKVKVLRTVRLPGKNSKPGKVIVTLDSEKAVEEILHVTKPRNPTDGRYVLLICYDLDHVSLYRIRSVQGRSLR